MRHHTSIRTMALSAIVTLACNSFSEPGQLTGTLEVLVTVTGMPTDSGSHTVVITLAGLGDLPPSMVDHEGGSFVVHDLPAGTHSVHLESPATTCWVTSPNPRPFTIQGGRTIQVGFAVSCYGPPAVVFNRSSPHSQATRERYVLESGGIFHLQFLSLSFGFGEFPGMYTPEGTTYLFRFDANGGEWVATGTLSGQCLTVTYTSEMETFEGFERGEFCTTTSVPLGSYERVSSSNGSGSSRLVFEANGRYRLQSQWPQFGFFEHRGSYALGGGGITLSFDPLAGIGDWGATVTQRGDSLIVRHANAPTYPPIEDAVYVRSPDPEFARDAGGRIAFWNDSNAVAYIYVANPDGSDVTQLTAGMEPTWSWDGRRIAFVRWSGDSGPPAIHVMDADASNQIRLGEGRMPAWSPDGLRIVYSLDTAIIVMNADGSDRREIANLVSPGIPEGSTQLQRPSWSPDGQSIAFDSWGGTGTVVQGSMQIHIIDPDGTNLRRLSDDGWSKYAPAWSVNGDRIMARSYDFIQDGGSTGFDMVLASYDVGSGERQVQYRIHMGWLVDGPDRSPSGRYLAFMQAVYAMPASPILILDAETGRVYSSSPGIAGARDLAWSRN